MLPGPSTSEVTTLQRYTNLFIIIIINCGSVVRAGMWPDAARRSWRRRDAGRFSQRLPRHNKHDARPHQDRD